MKRVLIALAAGVVFVAVALLVSGGLSYHHELEYVDRSGKLDEFPSISIQNIEVSSWGNRNVLGSSVWGPPFDLHIGGSLPAETTVTSVTMSNLKVEAEGTVLFSVPKVAVPLDDETVIKGPVTGAAKGLWYSARAFTSRTPGTIAVSGVIVLDSPAGSRTISFKKILVLNRIRRLSLGSHTWNL